VNLVVRYAERVMPDQPWIVSDPAVLGGKPCIRATRISVQHVLELLAERQQDAVRVRVRQS